MAAQKAAIRRAVPDPGGEAIGYGYGLISVRQRNAVVDQRVDRRLDVDVRSNDAGLLQRKSRLQDRVFLRRTDLGMRQLGAFLELLVDDGVRQFGDRDEDLLHLVIIGQRKFAGFLVDPEYALHELGLIFQEFLAHVEDAPGIGVLVA